MAEAAQLGSGALTRERVANCELEAEWLTIISKN